MIFSPVRQTHLSHTDSNMTGAITRPTAIYAFSCPQPFAVLIKESLRSEYEPTSKHLLGCFDCLDVIEPNHPYPEAIHSAQEDDNDAITTQKPGIPSAAASRTQEGNTHILLMNLSLFTGLPFLPFVIGVSVHISFCST